MININFMKQSSNAKTFFDNTENVNQLSKLLGTDLSVTIEIIRDCNIGFETFFNDMVKATDRIKESFESDDILELEDQIPLMAIYFQDIALNENPLMAMLKKTIENTHSMDRVREVAISAFKETSVYEYLVKDAEISIGVKASLINEFCNKSKFHYNNDIMILKYNKDLQIIQAESKETDMLNFAKLYIPYDIIIEASKSDRSDFRIERIK